MPQVTVVNPHHWLQDDGSFPEQVRVRSRMVRVAQFIEAGGPLRRGEVRHTLVPCRWRPAGRACSGFMAVLKQKDDAILALCPTCEEDEFLIYEWEETPWARGPQPALQIPTAEGSDTRARGTESKDEIPGPSTKLLSRALKILGSSMTAQEVRFLIGGSPRPTDVLDAILRTLPAAPTRGAIERFLPVLIDEWNSTPRNDLDGLSPAEMRSAAEPLDLGRNRPCPCGSGKKFKRCCISKGQGN